MIFPGLAATTQFRLRSFLMILARDLGGTKCTLILFDIDANHLRPSYRLTAKTADFPDIESCFDNFRERAKREGHPLANVTSAGFGVAGAIVNDAVVCNNLPWTITRKRIAENLQIAPDKTVLLNDVEAASSSLEHLEPKDILELNPGTPQPRASRIYVGCEISQKILAKLKDGTFVRAFCNKTKLANELARIPIFVVLNQDAPVLGAAYAAFAAAEK